MTNSIFDKDYPRVKIARNAQIEYAYVLPAREVIALKSGVEGDSLRFLCLSVQHNDEDEQVIGYKKAAFDETFMFSFERIDTLITEKGTVLNLRVSENQISFLPTCSQHNNVSITCLIDVVKTSS